MPVEPSVSVPSTQPQHDKPMTDSTSPSPDEIVIVPNQLTKRILREGEANTQPPKGANCKVHYIGRLPDGTEFDSSVKRNEPFQFKVGTGSVIKGWDEGVVTMNKGEKAMLICSPDYAYGSQGTGNIPPNSTLHFEVELLDYDDMTALPGTNNNVLKRVIIHGEDDNDGGYNRPADGATVTVTYSLRTLGPSEQQLVSEEAVDWTLGEELFMCKGVEIAIKSMTKGEKSLFIIKPELGFATSPLPESLKHIFPQSTLEYTIELKDFKSVKESWGLNKNEKLDRMSHLKQVGNAFFKAGQYQRACEKYSAAIDTAPFESDDGDSNDTSNSDRLTEQQKQQLKQLKVQCNCNRAVCESKLSNWRTVIDCCNNVLSTDDKHVKCWFLRGKAFMQSGAYEDAKHDLSQAQQLDKNKTREISTLLQQVIQKINQQIQRERQAFGGFFNKVRLVSEEEVAKAKEEAENKNKELMDDSSDEDIHDEAPKVDGLKESKTPEINAVAAANDTETKPMEQDTPQPQAQ